MSMAARVLWLKTGAVITILTGLTLAAAAAPSFAAPTEMLVHLLVPDAPELEPLGTPVARALLAVTGGLLAGWGSMLWLVASRLLAHQPGLARSLVVSSVAAWFVVDSAMSIAAGSWPNVFLNVAFLGLLLPPVVSLPERGRPRNPA